MVAFMPLLSPAAVHGKRVVSPPSIPDRAIHSPPVSSAGALHLLLMTAAFASAWPVWRFGLWSLRRGRSLGAISLVLATLALLVGLGVALAAGLPEIVPVLVVAALWLWFLCRRRSTWGRRRGLPPGGLAWLDVEPVDDQRAIAERFRRHGPVVKFANTLPVRRFRPTVCIAGLDRGIALLERSRDDLRVPALPSHDGVPLGFLRIMEGATHERYESVVAGALGLARESLRDQTTRRTVREHLAATPVTWYPNDVTGPLVRDVFRRTLLGVTPGSALADRLDHALAQVQRTDRRWVPVRWRRRAYRTAIDVLLGAEHELGHDAVLAEALRRGRTAALEDAAIVGNVLQMFTTGGNDSAGLLAWTLVELARRPAHQALLRDALDGQRPEAVTAYVREVLRLHQSEYLLRVTRRPITVDGHRIPAGWLVRICVAESHRDPAVFDRAEELVPDRFLDAPPGPPAFVPFGTGRHRCLGSGVAIATVSTAVEETLRCRELRLVHDAPDHHDAAHWTPGAALRLAATSLASNRPA
jgi:cytochrome P450